jgi:hypothetical protein
VTYGNLARVVCPRFEELSEGIVFFIESGRADDLAEAYDLAERFSASTAFATDR